METTRNKAAASSSGATQISTLLSLASAAPTDETEEQILGPKKAKYKRNEVSFAPKVGRNEGAVPLRFFSAPTYNDDKEKVLSMGSNSSGGHFGGQRGGSKAQSGANGLLKSRTRKSQVNDALSFCQQLFTTTLTDAQAEDVVYPYAIPNYSIELLAAAIAERMIDTVSKLAWNRPQPRPDWCDDLRFLGDWWICLSDRRSERTAAVQAALQADPKTEETVYPPLLSPDARTEEDEEQLIADLALRFQGHLYHLEVLHIDHIHLSPDRLQVLLFGGLVARRIAEGSVSVHGCRQDTHTATTDTPATKQVHFAPAGSSSKTQQGLPLDAAEDAMTVLSLSICHISAAGALIVLSALAHLASGKPYITTLDLSFNVLNHRALACFARMLPLTRVTRLSLRGNPLASSEPGALREFLREGAGLLQELDLGHTRLSYSQVCTLIECLPEMYALRFLLLDHVEVPPEKTSAFSKAIINSRVWHVSLNGVTACASDAYMAPILEACERHRREALDGASLVNGFFQRFFKQSYAKGWRPPRIYALPEGYGLFTGNDPSLHSSRGTAEAPSPDHQRGHV